MAQNKGQMGLCLQDMQKHQRPVGKSLPAEPAAHLGMWYASPRSHAALLEANMGLSLQP